jgi:deoxyribose-phosphate aldolase
MSISKENLKDALEHTLLAKEIDEKHVLAHLDEARDLGVFGVCIPLAFVPLAKKHLADTAIKIVTVIDFPLGQKGAEEKALEAKMAKALGADEIDMVLDYEALIRKDYNKALDDLCAVVDEVSPIPVKVIVETSALNHDQLIAAITLVALSNAAFIKTSTGFHQGGAKAEDIALMRELLPQKIQIKASGGVKDRSTAEAMLKAGASRIGASRSREILT